MKFGTQLAWLSKADVKACFGPTWWQGKGNVHVSSPTLPSLRHGQDCKDRKVQLRQLPLCGLGSFCFQSLVTYGHITRSKHRFQFQYFNSPPGWQSGLQLQRIYFKQLACSLQFQFPSVAVWD
jgi:hypothetical protein